MSHFWVKLFASGCFLGYSPLISGTVGSLGGGLSLYCLDSMWFELVFLLSICPDFAWFGNLGFYSIRIYFRKKRPWHCGD